MKTTLLSADQRHDTQGPVMGITESALLRRINRRLAREEPYPRKICKTREGSSDRAVLGEYYVFNCEHGFATDWDIDLEDWGRELGVL